MKLEEVKRKLENGLVHDLLRHARTLEAVARIELERFRDEEAKLIAEAVAAHSSLPEHYWVPRWKAEKKLDALRRLIEVFEEPT